MKALILILFLVFCTYSCSKEDSDAKSDLSDYTESEAIDLNYRCFTVFNQFALKQSNTYEDGAVKVDYNYTADIINAQYQGTVDLTFTNYFHTDMFSINGSGNVIGLMDSYNGQYVVTYSGNLNGADNEKSFEIEFSYEIIQAQSISNVGYFKVNGVRYDFEVDGSDLPNIVKK